MPLEVNDLGKIFAEVQENSRRLRSCSQHLFSVHDVKKMGQKLPCYNCGGRLALTDIGFYISGFKAAGGDPNEIMPGYEGAE